MYPKNTPLFYEKRTTQVKVVTYVTKSLNSKNIDSFLFISYKLLIKKRHFHNKSTTHFQSHTFYIKLKKKKKIPFFSFHFHFKIQILETKKMSTGELLTVDPIELKFPCMFSLYNIYIILIISTLFLYILFDYINLIFFVVFVLIVELKKQISSSLQLTNKTDNHVGFKV